MRAYVIIILFTIQNLHSASICDSDCLCSHRRSENEYQGETIVCRYNPSILGTNNTATMVHILDLTSNDLTRIYASKLLRSGSMVELILKNNQIEDIATNSFDLPELKKLDLSGNKLEFIHGDVFGSIAQLEYLNLANNKFSSYAKLSFHRLGNLQEIVLNNNDIGSSLQQHNLFDRSGFGLTRKIKSVSIGYVNLNSVPDNFFIDAYDLKKLVICGNGLIETFEIPYTLEYLDLSENPIKEISEEDFADVPALKHLKLNNLLIKEVPGYVFAPLRGLLTLELERNKNLTVFNPQAFGQDVLDDADDFALETLSLKSSRLKGLDESLSEPFGRLNKLDLQGNPWRCDCNLVWMKKLQISSKDYEHLRCATPTPFFNAKIFELDSKYFLCPEHNRHVGIAIAVISLCVTLSAIAIWLFMFLPKYHSRCSFLQGMFAPAAAYATLPLNPTGNTGY